MNEFERDLNVDEVASQESITPEAAPETPLTTESEYPSPSSEAAGVFFNGSATPDGTGYSTPNGGHGFAYAPAEDNGKNGKYQRGRPHAAIVAAIVVGSLLVLTAAIFLGTVLIMNLSQAYGLDSLVSGEYNGSGSSNNGLVIENETDGKTPSGNDGESSGERSPSEPPEGVTITKSESLRKDEDGDGKADYAYGDDGEVLTSADKNVYSAATVVAKVADSVVEITTEKVVSNWYGQTVVSGAGSGVIICPEGYIVTNNHVVEGANSIKVRLTDGSEYRATLVGTDAQTDIAVIWIDRGERELTVATLGSSFDLVVGEDVLAIGNPMGSLGGTVTYGKISTTAREIKVDSTAMTLLQIDAPINPGNSGGALFNMAGQMVGVVNAKMSSTGIEGLGFAIPVDTAYDVILDLINYGYVQGRPDLGMTLRAVQNRYTGRTYLCVVESPYTDEVQTDDLILAVGDMEISTFSDLTNALALHKIGDSVEVTLYRNTKTLTVTVTLREYTPS